MKKKAAPFLFTFLLILVLTQSAAASPAEFLLNLLRNAAAEYLHRQAEAAEPPKVIDRINNPESYPDFAFPEDADLLEIWFPAVRDQDAAVFLYQGQVWMLDCGDERAKDEIVPLLRFMNIEQIDRMINTHPHHDHINGLYAVDAEVPVRELMICFPGDITRHMTAAMEYCKGSGISVSTYADESVLGMGDGLVSFLAWLKADEKESLNDRSAQFMVSYGDCSILFMADLEWAGMNQLFDSLSPEDLKADILRYPHHGKSRMLDPLFDAIGPALTVITNTSRIFEIKSSTKFLDNKHAAAAYTHRPHSVLRLRTDGRHWLGDQVPVEPPSVPEDGENPDQSAQPGSAEEE